MEPDLELEEEVNYLVGNIRYSDNGSLEKIQNRGCLKHDLIEWSNEYEQVVHLA